MGLGRGRKFVSLRFYLRISFPPSRVPPVCLASATSEISYSVYGRPPISSALWPGLFRPNGRFWRYPTTGYRPRSAGSARSAHTFLWGALALFIRVRAKSLASSFWYGFVWSRLERPIEWLGASSGLAPLSQKEGDGPFP